jgi:hypothetical protein
VVGLLAGGGFVYWSDTRFPATSEQLSGTPVELLVQRGVTQRDLRAVRDGLRLEHRYMKKTFGKTVRGHVVGRVAHGTGCRPFQSSGGALVGEADNGFVCIDTTSLGWQWLVLQDLTAATSISAHEYVHVLQAELGCLPKQVTYRWIIEGMATDLAWRALIEAGRATDARAKRTIRRDGALDTNLEPLANYELETGRDREYALWHLAVRRLLRKAVDDGAAPAPRPEVALYRFCARVGRGHSWRAAFRRSFGLRVGHFYADFWRDRQIGALASNY